MEVAWRAAGAACKAGAVGAFLAAGLALAIFADVLAESTNRALRVVSC